MFQGMIANIQEDIAKLMFRVNIATEARPESHLEGAKEVHGEEAVEEPKKPYVNHDTTGRNDLCPCGSGKKYKKCCGKE